MRARPPFPRFRRAALAGAAMLTLAASATIAVSPAVAAKKPTSVSKTSGAVTAKVSYTPANPKLYQDYSHLRLTVTGPSGGLTKVKMPHNSGSHTRPILTLVDLNGDGIPDPIVDTYSGGAHCCSTSSIAISTPTGFGPPITQAWGDYGYQLKTIAGAPTPILASADDRFAYAFTAYAGSIPAIQLWSVAGGTFTDVTRNYPDLIRADAATDSDYWNSAAKDATKHPDYGTGEVQAVTAAWVADLSMLGDYVGAKAVIDKTTAAGWMKGGDKEDWEQSDTFAGQLSYSLKAWGYLADPTLIGLPAPPS